MPKAIKNLNEADLSQKEKGHSQSPRVLLQWVGDQIPVS